RWPRDWSSDVCSSDLTIAVVGPELAGPSAGVQPPPVVQLDVHVRVGSALHGRARSGPVLLPVEVPECRLIERAGMPRLEREPCVPALLIGLPQEAQVVHLEALRAALVGGLKPSDSTAHLSEFELL